MASRKISEAARLRRDKKSLQESCAVLGSRLEQIKIATFGNTGYRNWEQIISQIQGFKTELEKLREYKHRVEGGTRVETELMFQENSKLWYLLRAIMKDETLKNEPANHESLRMGGITSPFGKPRF